MKRFKLIKDLPDIKAGEISTNYHTRNDIEFVTFSTRNKNPANDYEYQVKYILNNPTWFELIETDVDDFGHKLIYIEWCDAVNGNPHWLTKDQVIEWAEEGEWIVKQTGWLVKETKEYILLGFGLREGDAYSESNFLGAMQIPKGCIKKQVDLTEYIN